MNLFNLGRKKDKNQNTQAPYPALAKLEKGTVSLTDVISPSSVEVDFKFIKIGETFYRTFFIADYPRFVSANWIEPVIDFDHTMDIAMFIYPASSPDVLSDLKRKIAEMEATISSQAQEGVVIDPKVTAALEDALALQEELAKGVERFFQLSFYLTLSSESPADLEQASKKLQTTLGSILLLPKTATLQMEEGFKSTAPLGQDKIFITRNMDTTSLATTFPFTSAILTQNKGVLYGINAQNNSLIVFDRFSLENANEVILGKSGSGKSFLIKLEIMRQFMFGTEVIVVDPEGEYEALCQTLGGEYMSFTQSSPIKINPFDLSGLYEEGENELGLKILSLHGLLRIVMGELDPEQDAILDRALVTTYQQKGINQNPETQKKEPPLMEDLYKTLLGTEDPVAKNLALILEKFIKGSLSGIFNEQSNFDIKNPLTVFSIKAMEEELRPIAMHIILDFVWTKVRKDLRKRILILDEAWYMMKYEDSAAFVYSIAKRARKYFLGLTTVTQDAEDFLLTDYGKAVLSNSSLQILMKQGPSEVDIVAKTFYLSSGEKQLLLSAGIGEALFFAGQNHVAMRVVAADFEHRIVTTNPLEKAQSQAQETVPSAQQAVPAAQSPIPQTVPNQQESSSHPNNEDARQALAKELFSAS
ncbi:ATP-binding protein [Patescibacteria group bacterium]|nr:ATP-binding protein [Patescibacteria group bacterium]MCL5010193.1 ATP-binding protein [Patescibacteria group bacterium]